MQTAHKDDWDAYPETGPSVYLIQADLEKDLKVKHQELLLVEEELWVEEMLWVEEKLLVENKLLVKWWWWNRRW